MAVIMSRTAVPPAPGRPPRYPRSNSLEFGAYREAVPLARRHTRSVLAEWGLAELSDDTEAVVTELIENAIQATARAGLDNPVRLTLLAGLRTVLIVVRDAVPDPPVPRRPADGDGDDLDLGPWTGDDDTTDPDTRGRGLLIVAALSACWDWKHTPDGGKVVRSLIRGQRYASLRLIPDATTE